MQIYIPQKRAEQLIKKFIQFNDQDAKQLLINAGCFKAIPKRLNHALMHDIFEPRFKCWRCWAEFGSFSFYRKWKNNLTKRKK